MTSSSCLAGGPTGGHSARVPPVDRGVESRDDWPKRRSKHTIPVVKTVVKCGFSGRRAGGRPRHDSRQRRGATVGGGAGMAAETRGSEVEGRPAASTPAWCVEPPVGASAGGLLPPLGSLAQGRRVRGPFGQPAVGTGPQDRRVRGRGHTGWRGRAARQQGRRGQETRARLATGGQGTPS